MTEFRDGGTAFPAAFTGEQWVSRDGDQKFGGEFTGGMTLRDYFAAKALQAEIITTCSDATPGAAENAVRAAAEEGVAITDHIAQNAYRWADAMLKAREVKL